MIRAYRSECGRRIGGSKLDVTCAALLAFDGHAIDYLLKPFDRDRFDAALDRARRLIEGGRQTDISHEILDLLRRER